MSLLRALITPTAPVRRLLAACLMPLLAALAFALPAAAQTAGQVDSADTDPALEKRLWEIAVELRCLVCQNQTIADSNADLAVDLRNQVRTMLKQGKSQREIIDYMTARYGDFVLYRPPVKETTWLLWFGPGLLMVGGVAALWWVLHRRTRLPADRFEPDEDDELEGRDGDAASADPVTANDGGAAALPPSKVSPSIR